MDPLYWEIAFSIRTLIHIDLKFSSKKRVRKDIIVNSTIYWLRTNKYLPCNAEFLYVLFCVLCRLRSRVILRLLSMNSSEESSISNPSTNSASQPTISGTNPKLLPQQQVFSVVSSSSQHNLVASGIQIYWFRILMLRIAITASSWSIIGYTFISIFTRYWWNE